MEKVRFLPVMLLLLVSVPAQSAPPLRGARYRWIDSMALSVSTTFKDATVVASRLPSGHIQSDLNSSDDVATMNITPAGLVVIRIGGGRVETITTSLAEISTLDDSNVLLYETWNSYRTSVTANVSETGDPLSFTKRGAKNVSAKNEVREITTEFAEVTVRSRHHGSALLVPTFTTGLFPKGQGDATVMLQWFESSALLQWRQPNGTIGEVNAARLPAGWTFAPDEAWANAQAYSFFHADADRKAKKALLRTSSLSLTPIATAEEDGCTGLHWLDDTIFRECCDEHDRCYIKENPDCTALSWIFPRSWACLGCNIAVVLCFLTEPFGGGGGGGEYPRDPLNLDPFSCGYSEGYCCPAYCSYCW